MGNMLCINNHYCRVDILVLANQEGFIIKRTISSQLAYALVRRYFLGGQLAFLIARETMTSNRKYKDQTFSTLDPFLYLFY